MLERLPTVETKDRPAINSAFIPMPDLEEPRTLDLKKLIWWIKRTPECIGIIKRIATDIVTTISFNSVKSPTTGRPGTKLLQQNEDRASSFFRQNLARNKIMAWVTDSIMTGDGYLWMGKITDTMIKETATKYYKEMNIEMKEIEVKDFFDEDFNRMNRIEVLPSSMTFIKHDDNKIHKYIQKTASSPGKDMEFLPSDIIHAKFMELDGKVYGFSPMVASFISILTINGIQDYGYNFFANGVKADRAWMFQGAVSQDYLDKFEEVLKKYKSMRNSHSDLVIAGADKITSERLNEITEEMEYRKLAIHSVGRLAFAFNMPADTLSSILGVDVKGTAMGSDIEDAGYNRNIEQMQLYYEDLLNTQLWLPEFKVEMRFQRNYRQDQIKYVQYLTQAQSALDWFFKHEYPVSDEYSHEMLQIPRRLLTKGSIKKEVEEVKPLDMGAIKGPNQQKRSDVKKAQQKPQNNISPPNGS